MSLSSFNPPKKRVGQETAKRTAIILQIIEVLKEKSMTVDQIQSRFHLGQRKTYRYLQIIEMAGLKVTKDKNRRKINTK